MRTTIMRMHAVTGMLVAAEGRYIVAQDPRGQANYLRQVRAENAGETWVPRDYTSEAEEAEEAERLAESARLNDEHEAWMQQEAEEAAAWEILAEEAADD